MLLSAPTHLAIMKTGRLYALTTFISLREPRACACSKEPCTWHFPKTPRVLLAGVNVIELLDPVAASVLHLVRP